jgi:hypothetical protein
LKFTLQKSEGAGNAGRRLAPAVSCARCTQECAHEHTGTAGAARHSLRNGLTAYAELSLETNSSCLHRQRIDGSRRPVGRLQTSASLTPATGARTTRFCRTQLPPPNHSASQCRRPNFWRKRLSAVRLTRDVRSRITALRTPLAPDAAASTATRPNVRDDGQRPSSGTARVVRVIWGSREADYFCGRDWTGQISLKLLKKIAQSQSRDAMHGRLLRLDAVECTVTVMQPHLRSERWLSSSLSSHTRTDC